MMSEKKFDTKKLAKLNNPDRLKDMAPEVIWEKLNIEQADVLVEIGAGTAFFSKAFLDLAGSAKLYACDLSPVMIDWMRENIVRQYPNITPIQTEESTIPLNDGIADLVFMINLHHELDDPALIIQETRRLLKPGGSVFVVDWDKKFPDQGPPSEIRSSAEQVKEQLEQTGFNHINTYEDLTKHFLVTGRKKT